MDFAAILDVVNVVLLALFGVAGWRMVDEWRKSHDAKHAAELASCAGELKATKEHHALDLKVRDLQLEQLQNENSRLSQKQDERTALLEEQIDFLKLQAPAGVRAQFDALKQWQEERLAELERENEHRRATHEEALRSRDARIAELEAIVARPRGLGADMSLRNMLRPPTLQERLHVESDRMNARDHAKRGDAAALIDDLGHWDADVRHTAADALVSLGSAAVPPLMEVLRGTTPANGALFVVGFFLGRRLQRLFGIARVLGAIGEAAPALEPWTRRTAGIRKERALAAMSLTAKA